MMILASVIYTDLVQRFDSLCIYHGKVWQSSACFTMRL